MSKLQFPTLNSSRYLVLKAGDSFPDITTNLVIFIKGTGTYDLSVKQGSTGIRLLFKNSMEETIYIKLTSTVTISIEAKTYTEVVYNQTAWEILLAPTEITNSNLLSKILSIDGHGSEIDADKVDGIEGADLLKLASGGYGQPIDISNTNIDTADLKTGFYIGNTLTGAPTTDTYFIVHMRFDVGSLKSSRQLAFPTGAITSTDGNLMYSRQQNPATSAWSAWTDFTVPKATNATNLSGGTCTPATLVLPTVASTTPYAIWIS